MSCYHPLAARQQLNENENGKKPIQIVGKYSPELALSMPDVFPLPCGKCVGCRLDYSRQWADRMILELDHSKKGIFLTLTYDDDHIPVGQYDEFDQPLSYSLYKRDLQLFMKRLRKRFSDLAIRFYAAGEYGTNTMRPHYHAILFGISLSDFPDSEIQGRNNLGQEYYRSDLMYSIWQNGFALMSDVSWKTCAYVARYVMKKVGVDDVNREYAFSMLNIEDEFTLMSRRPGIGAYFFEDHPELIEKKLTKYFVGDQDGSKEVGIPKFLLGKLEAIDSEFYMELKEERKHLANDRMLLELKHTDLEFFDYNSMKEKKKLEQIEGLNRNKYGL